MKEVIYETPFRNVIMPVPESGEVEILYSGGADSTMVLYLMLLNNIKIDRIKTMHSHYANASNAKYLKPLEWLEKRFDVDLKSLLVITHVDTVVEKTTSLILKPMVKAPWLYTGTMKNGPAHIYANDPDFAPYDLDHLNHVQNQKYAMNPHLLAPFGTLDKRPVMWLYDQFELEELLALTESCVDASRPLNCTCCQCNYRNWASEEVQKAKQDGHQRNLF
jgi:7-cyano-7-deazaguanine synthase in queuosine biosynthesis